MQSKSVFHCQISFPSNVQAGSPVFIQVHLAILALVHCAENVLSPHRAKQERPQTMKNSALRLVTPTPEKRTVVMPVRKPNAELRTREYLTAAEVEKLIEVARGNRWGLRDATMILVAFRHGFRSSELTDMHHFVRCDLWQVA